MARDHAWQDTALILGPTGRGWVAGQSFVCTRCKVERRMIYTGKDESETRTSIFFVRGKRQSKAPECT
jgi:hypothetical protein